MLRRNSAASPRRIKMMLLPLLLLAAGPLHAQENPVVTFPTDGLEVRGDGSDGNNLLRWTIGAQPDFFYNISIIEIDPETDAKREGTAPATILIESPQPGSSPFQIPLDYNNETVELQDIGTGLFELEMSSFLNPTGSRVRFFKGRPYNLNLDIQDADLDDPADVTFRFNFLDPDNTPDYLLDVQFRRLSDGVIERNVSRTDDVTSGTEDDLSNSPISLQDDTQYEAILTVTDTRNADPENGLGLSATFTTTPFTTNDYPETTITQPNTAVVDFNPGVPITTDVQVYDKTPDRVTVNLAVSQAGQADQNLAGVFVGPTPNYLAQFNVLYTTTTGNVTLNANATDNRGLLGIDPAQPVTFRLNAIPVLDITQPIADAVINWLDSGSNIPVSAFLNDDHTPSLPLEISREAGQPLVNFGSHPRGQVTTVNVNGYTTSGVKLLTARTTDGDGRFIEDAVQFRLNARPVLDLTQPGEGTVYDWNDPTSVVPVAAYINDDFTASLPLDIRRDASAGFLNFGSFPRNSNVAVNVNGYTTSGLKTLTARVTDGDGFATEVSRQVRLNAAPVINIVQPQADAVINWIDNTTNIPFSAFLNDDFSSPLQLSVSRELGDPLTDRGNFPAGQNAVVSLNGYTTSGVKLITASVTDGDGRVSQASRQYRLNARPVFTALEPEDGIILYKDGDDAYLHVAATVVDDFSTNLQISIQITGPQNVNQSLPATSGVPAMTSILLQQYGVYTVTYTATDGDSYNSAPITRTFIVNDVPQAIIDHITPGVTNDEKTSTVVQWGGLTQFYLSAINLVREEGQPLVLRYRFSDADPFTTLNELEPGTGPQTESLILEHTYETTETQVFTFEAIETFNDGSVSTGTVTRLIVPGELPPLPNAARRWDLLE